MQCISKSHIYPIVDFSYFIRRNIYNYYNELWQEENKEYFSKCIREIFLDIKENNIADKIESISKSIEMAHGFCAMEQRIRKISPEFDWNTYYKIIRFLYETHKNDNIQNAIIRHTEGIDSELHVAYNSEMNKSYIATLYKDDKRPDNKESLIPDNTGDSIYLIFNKAKQYPIVLLGIGKFEELFRIDPFYFVIYENL